jgi:hypothetical protein
MSTKSTAYEIRLEYPARRPGQVIDEPQRRMDGGFMDGPARGCSVDTSATRRRVRQCGDAHGELTEATRRSAGPLRAIAAG